MKKITKVTALILALLMILTACGTPEYSKGLDANGYFSGVKATDYFTITDLDSIVISGDDIDEELYNLTAVQFPDDNPSEIVDRAVTEEDEVNVDYVGKIDGVEFDGGSSEGTEIDIDDNNLVDGFSDQLVGHMPGEIFDINVTFPEDYGNEELNGKDAVFTITLNYIIQHNYTQAEFDDEFVQTNLYYYYYYYYGESITTAEDYIDMLKQSLAQEYLDEHCTLTEGKEVPEAVQEWVNDITLANLKAYAKNYYSEELVTYLKDQYEVNSSKEYLEKYADDLEESAVDYLQIQALAEYYGLSVDEETIKAKFDDDSDDTISYEEAVENYGLPYLMKYYLQDAVTEHIEEITVVE